VHATIKSPRQRKSLTEHESLIPRKCRVLRDFWISVVTINQEDRERIHLNVSIFIPVVSCCQYGNMFDKTLRVIPIINIVSFLVECNIRLVRSKCAEGISSISA